MATAPTLDTIPLFQLRTGPKFQYREPKLIPAVPSGSLRYTEFYTQSTGANINAGSTTDANAIYTSTNGNWSTVTAAFIPTDGTNPVAAGVTTDQFASIYLDGATTAVYIARIISVQNAVNGAIVIQNAASAGVAPVTGATGRSIKVGGAWLGPNGASGFPFTLGNFNRLLNSNSNQLRVNMKNDASYSVTASFTMDQGVAKGMIVQGYSIVPGDGGKATFDGGSSTSAIINGQGSAGNTFIDLIFTTSLASGSSNLAGRGNQTSNWIRCVFKNAAGDGLSLTTSGAAYINLVSECEFYNCNTSNTSTLGGIGSTGSVIVRRCFFHGLVGANNCAVSLAGSALIENCIFHGGVSGFNFQTPIGVLAIANNDFYQISGVVLPFASNVTSQVMVWIENNNFIQCGMPVNNLGAAIGFMYNNGYCDNKSLSVLGSIATDPAPVFYPYGSLPWKDPDNGDFSLVLAPALSVGRGVFIETQVYTAPNTVGYPDIGAAQANRTTQGFAQNVGKQTLPYGYVNHYYSWQWGFASPTTVSVVSGSLPPGLILVQATPQLIFIQGTPTTVGTYDFTLRATVGGSSGDSAFEITVFTDPDEGIGGIICGP